MSSMVGEIAIIAGSSIAGAVSAAFIVNRISKTKSSSKKEKQHQQQQPFAKPPSNIRSEFSSLQFEKSVIGESITRVYEAHQEGKIDRAERDRLLVKYRQQLDSLNQKIGGIEPAAGVVSLVDIRNSLVSLLEERISTIDSKLAEITEKNGGSRDLLVKPTPQRNTQAVMSEPEERIGQPIKEPSRSDERSIEQLQDEIMQALYRLEQVEVDKG